MYVYIVIFDGYHFVFEEPQKMASFIKGVIENFPKFKNRIQIYKSIEMELKDFYE